jgi:hypothetical protein
MVPVVDEKVEVSHEIFSQAAAHIRGTVRKMIDD